MCGGSKTYCGYCKRVKDLFQQLGASYKVVELDTESKSAMNTLSSDFMFGLLYLFSFLVRSISFSCLLSLLILCFRSLFSS